jgi:hypothetical protein
MLSCTSLLRLESSLTITSHGSITGSHAVSIELYDHRLDRRPRDACGGRHRDRYQHKADHPAWAIKCRHDAGKRLQHLHDFGGQTPQHSQGFAQFQLHERPPQHITHDDPCTFCLDHQVEAILRNVLQLSRTAVSMQV